MQRAIADYLDGETAWIDALIEKRTTSIALYRERFVSKLVNSLRTDDGWTQRKVSWDYAVQLGKMLNPTASSGPDPRPYLRNLNVQWDRIDLDDVAVMSFDSDDRARFSLLPGDLLVCEGGEVGRAAVWQGELSECYYQKALHRVRPRGSAVPRFLMYWLWASARLRVFEVEGNQSTIVHLTAEQLAARRFPAPAPEGQARIVRALDEVRRVTEAAVEKLERQVTLLREKRQALITAAVNGQIPIPGAA
jgi:type I restriction enzyme S subunit